MIYVFDTAPLSTLFKNFYPARFPTLWKHFDGLVDNGSIVSTREVAREIGNGAVEALRQWAADHVDIFPAPTADEGQFVLEIYKVQHFQNNIKQQKLLKGGILADPFVIAKAKIIDGTVVTMEKFKPNSAKIPNICDHFDIPCMDLEKFMEEEGWTF